MDSILCAKNIQQAILPDHKKLNSLFKEAFVYSKGRDVVSGDFYWFAEKNGKIFIAAVDCTGHGVPAAYYHLKVFGWNWTFKGYKKLALICGEVSWKISN